MKKYIDQHRLEPPLFEYGNLMILNKKNIKTHRLARKRENKLYRLYIILHIIPLTAVRLHLPKRCTIHTVFHVSLLEPIVNDNRDIDSNAFLTTSDPSENTIESEVDQVMSSTFKDRRVLYLVTYKGYSAKNH
jgi:hypothetical protein